MSRENQSLSASSWYSKHIHPYKSIVACELLPGGYCNMLSINTLKCPSTRNWSLTAQSVLCWWSWPLKEFNICVCLQLRDMNITYFTIMVYIFNSTSFISNTQTHVHYTLHTFLLIWDRSTNTFETLNYLDAMWDELQSYAWMSHNESTQLWCKRQMCNSTFNLHEHWNPTKLFMNCWKRKSFCSVSLAKLCCAFVLVCSLHITFLTLHKSTPSMLVCIIACYSNILFLSNVR